ncbi:UNVERIFIED_CONTAM: hypothetical protein K2H54_042787 [Gekko kuhli]
MSSGRSGFLWPGLNAPVLKGGTIQMIGQRGEEEREKMQLEIIRQRDEWAKRRKTRVKRERGWTGHSWGGISLGPPDPGPNGGLAWPKVPGEGNESLVDPHSIFLEGQKDLMSPIPTVLLEDPEFGTFRRGIDVGERPIFWSLLNSCKIVETYEDFDSRVIQVSPLAVDYDSNLFFGGALPGNTEKEMKTVSSQDLSDCELES